MVKASKTKKSEATANKTDRIIMRMHPDLLEVLDARADEQGLTRSKYLFLLLAGWANADPRNKRVDRNGVYVENAPDPRDLQRARPTQFGEKWASFSAAHTVVMGAPPPRDWLEMFDDENNPHAPPFPIKPKR